MEPGVETAEMIKSGASAGVRLDDADAS